MSQQQAILKHLQNNTITPLDALNLYGCFRLAAVIHVLRDAGHNIETEAMTMNGKTFANYRLQLKGQTSLF